jgi:hypothetical protein
MQLAAELLMLVAEHGGDPMMARIAIMKALHRREPARLSPRRRREGVAVRGARVIRISLPSKGSEDEKGEEEAAGKTGKGTALSGGHSRSVSGSDEGRSPQNDRGSGRLGMFTPRGANKG